MLTKLKTSSKRVFIKKNVVKELIKEGDSSPYKEICHGLVVSPQRGATIINHKPLTNIALNPLHLYIPCPLEFKSFMFDIYRHKKWGENAIFGGMYHTHPKNKAFPSFKDLKGTGYKGVYIIYSPLFNQFNPFWVDSKKGNWKFLNLKIK